MKHLENRMTDLVTKADFKTYMSISSTNQDAIIDFLIPKISAFVKTYCRRDFIDWITIPKEEYFNGGIPFYSVQEQPVIGIQDLFYSTDYGQTYTALVLYTDYAIDGNILYPISNTEFPYTLRGYRLVYTAGYTSVPNDLKLAVYDLISYYMKNDATVNAVKRTNTTTMQIEYITDTALPSHIKRVLDMYVLDYN